MIKEVKFLKQTTTTVVYAVYGENLTEEEIDNNKTISADAPFGCKIQLDGTAKAYAKVICYKD